MSTPDGTTPERHDDDRDLTVPDDLSALTEADGAGDVVVPDDLSGLLDGAAETSSIALVVTQVAAPEPLAAACAIANVEVDAVPTSVGAVAVLRDPAAAEAGAAAISQLLRQLPVVLLTRREGQIAAVRWVNGRHDDDLPAGLVLADAPAVLEDLLLGSADVADVPGVVTSVGMSRWRAMRALARGRKR
ncbi:MAG: hypothetical protein NVV70_03050 [Cellulomonas sp.]|nr:hypothetical protein [Cellulomonas sp.]MCR6647154.1 hypothetical protein [Cellulomonas sp.]